MTMESWDSHWKNSLRVMTTPSSLALSAIQSLALTDSGRLFVADLGAGSGVLVSRLRDLYPGVTEYLVDFSIEAVYLAKDHGLNAHVGNLDFEQCVPPMVQSRGGFDIVVASAVMEFLPEYEFVRTLSHWTAKDGCAVIVTPSCEQDTRQMRCYTPETLAVALRRVDLFPELVRETDGWIVCCAKHS